VKLNRKELLEQAAALLQKPIFSREDSSRAERLMDLAEAVDTVEVRSAGERQFVEFLRTPGSGRAEYRDVFETGGSVQGGYFVPQGWIDRLFMALKKFDGLWDREVVTMIEAEKGGPYLAPAVDDTGSAAVQLAEGVQDTETDPSIEGTLLPQCPTYRTGLVKVSMELFQDSILPIDDFLARAFAPRLGRGISPALVTALLSGASAGLTATGNLNPGGLDGSNSIGYQDLVSLKGSIDPEYLGTPSVGFVMNNSTLTSLDNLTDKNGRPILDANCLDAKGRRMILGYPVIICPAMPSIAANAKPVAFGSLEYLAVRVVKPSTAVVKLMERFAEYGVVAFKAILRAQATLLCASAATPPVKYLLCAAS